MNFPERGNVWTTFCVLIDIANLMAVADIRNIGLPPDIYQLLQEVFMRARSAPKIFDILLEKHTTF